MKKDRLSRIIEETIKKHIMLKENINPKIADELGKHISQLQKLVQVIENKEHISKRDVDVVNIEKGIEHLMLAYRHIKK